MPNLQEILTELVDKEIGWYCKILDLSNHLPVDKKEFGRLCEISKAAIKTAEDQINQLERERVEKFRIGGDGWKILRCINTDEGITTAKACELVRDMLAGRPYKVPNYIAALAELEANGE